MKDEKTLTGKEFEVGVSRGVHYLLSEFATRFNEVENINEVCLLIGDGISWYKAQDKVPLVMDFSFNRMENEHGIEKKYISFYLVPFTIYDDPLVNVSIPITDVSKVVIKRTETGASLEIDNSMIIYRSQKTGGGLIDSWNYQDTGKTDLVRQPERKSLIGL